MKKSFANLVEEIRSRPQEEKEEIRFLLERSLIEGRRQQILENCELSRAELKAGQLKFSRKISRLKASLAGE